MRRLIHWFWHDLSHFITTIGRGKMWWAAGQIEALRRTCVDLACLRANFAQQAKEYEKVDRALPDGALAPLEATFCRLEPGPMIDAMLAIVEFYRELAVPLARTYGLEYPAALDRLMSDRLEKVRDANARWNRKGNDG